MDNNDCTMGAFLAGYTNPDLDKVNINIIRRENCDDDLVSYLVDASKSLEVLENIKFLGYEYVEDESQIDINDFISSRSTSKQEQEKRYMYIHDNRYGLVKFRFRATCFSKKENKIVTRDINKSILIPVADEEGYYTLKGKRFFLIYQLVDSSTYKTKDAVVLKSLLPVCIKREHIEIVDTEGEEYSVPIFKLHLFKKYRDVLIFYLAKIGLSRTLTFFGMDGIIEMVEETSGDSEQNMFFQISSTLFIKVDRKMFIKFKFVRSMVGMIKTICNSRTKLSMLESQHYWIEKIGSSGAKVDNAYERGRNSLTFLMRMLDKTTKKVLRLEKENKRNIYSIIRWMIMNFDELRSKDNLNFSHKRLRYNEFIGALYTQILSERLNRIIFKGKTLTIENIQEMFNFTGGRLISALQKSGLLVFDDRVNDCDLLTKLRASKKGAQTLGNKNSNNITKKYRSVHPSQLGRIDISTYGNSDPGASSSLTLQIQTYGHNGELNEGLYFSNEHDPEDMMYKIQNEMRERIIAEHDGNSMLILPGYTSKEEFFDDFEKMRKIYNGITIKSNNPDDIFNIEELRRIEKDIGRLEGEEAEQKRKEVSQIIIDEYIAREQSDNVYEFATETV